MPNLFAILVLAVAPAFSAESNADSTELRRLQLLKTQDLVIIDIRAPDAYAKGHIQGARNIPAQSLGTAKLPKDAHIVVYCGEDSCALGAQATQSLLDAGYTKVQSLAGGFAAWLKSGYPAQTGAQTGPKPDRLTAKDAKERLARSELIAVDVRPTLEFSAGHIPGARNLPLEDLDTVLKDLPKDKELLVYDRQAKRSSDAVQKLLGFGYKVSELSGGLAGWVQKKYPLETK